MVLLVRKAAELTLLPTRLLTEYYQHMPRWNPHFLMAVPLSHHPNMPLGITVSSVGATEEGWAKMKKGLE